MSSSVLFVSGDPTRLRAWDAWATALGWTGVCASDLASALRGAESAWLGIVDVDALEDWSPLLDACQTEGRLLLLSAQSGCAGIGVVHDPLREAEVRARPVFGEVSCDLVAGTVTGPAAAARLTGKECALIARLSATCTVPVSREDLLTEVWGFRDGVVSRAVDTAVRRLRQKLSDVGLRDVINTVRGVGYVWSARPAAPSPGGARSGGRRLVGRSELIGRLNRLLDEQRQLISLIGFGGVGKTALAEAVVASHPNAFFVDLRPVRTWDQVRVAIAGVLSEPLDQVEQALARRPELLLLLDDLRGIPEAAEHLRALLRRAPRLRVLVTAHRPVGLEAEVHIHVPPLDRETSLRMLRERYRMAGGHDGDWDDGHAYQLVDFVGGIPLGLSILAARAARVGLDLTCDRLVSDGEPVVGRRASAAEHASLEAAIRVTWDGLSVPEQAALSQLAVFRGAIAVEAALHILELEGCGVEVLESLRERGLLPRATGGHSHPGLAIGLVPPIQRLVSQWCPISPDPVLERFGAWVAKSVRLPRPLFFEMQQARRLAGMVVDIGRAEKACAHADRPDVVLALGLIGLFNGSASQALDNAETVLRERPDALARLAPVIGQLNIRVHGIGEATIHRCEQLLDDLENIGALRASALVRIELVFLHVHQGRGPEVWRPIGDQAVRAADESAQADVRILTRLSVGEHVAGRLPARVTAQYFSEALQIVQTEDTPIPVMLLAKLGKLEMERRNAARARGLFEQAIQVASERGILCQFASVVDWHGVACLEEGDLSEAERSFERALQLFTLRGQSCTVAQANLGRVAMARGQLDRAIHLLQGAVSAFEEAGSELGACAFGAFLAEAQMRRGDYAAVRVWLGRAERLGSTMPSSIRHVVDTLREQLGELDASERGLRKR